MRKGIPKISLLAVLNFSGPWIPRTATESSIEECLMSDLRSWELIAGPETARVILSIDFPGHPYLGHPGFAGLASLIGPQYGVLGAVSPPAPDCRPPLGPAWVDAWVQAIRQENYEVEAVFGCHVGSLYAAAIAEGVAQWQPIPAVVLFDPNVPKAEHLNLEFQREITAISSLLGAAEIELAEQMASEASWAESTELSKVASEIMERYFSIVSIAYERAGLGAARENKFAAAFASRMGWLCSAGELNPQVVWKHSTVIASSAFAGWPDHDRLGGAGPGRVIPFDVDHAELLRSGQVAAAVRQLLPTR
jgi:hypothetical protein